MRRMALPVLLFAVAACQAAPSSHPKIVRGQALTSNDTPTVALLRPDSQGAIYSACTGVLINARQVLTAAHCSVDADGAAYAATERWVVAGDSFPERSTAQRLAVSTIAVHPEFAAVQLGAASDRLVRPDSAHDLAVWTLAAPVTGVKPAAAVTAAEADAWLHDQQPLEIMGFGRQSDWDSPWLEHQLAHAETPFRSTVQLNLTRKVKENGRLITRKVELSFPGKSASEFYAGGVGLPDTCKGDSGGPAYVRGSDGSWLLLGITSRGASTCDSGGVYTLVAAHQAWLDTVAPR